MIQFRVFLCVLFLSGYTFCVAIQKCALAERNQMEIVTRLEKSRDKTLEYFALSNDELDLTYMPGKWTVRFILHHLADAETVLRDRICRAISEPKQVLWAFDQDAWAKGLDYANVPLEISREIYKSVRAGIIFQAKANYERNGSREFVHSETGLRTLKDEFDKVAWHNENHLEQIATALERAA
jgi:hypothetical protein